MLDFYKPTEGSVTEVNGKVKPAIVFAFGGGFVSGHRDKEHYQQWIKLLNDNGFAVFSIDYRLVHKKKKKEGNSMEENKEKGPIRIVCPGKV